MARKQIYETHTKPHPVWRISRHEQDQQKINHFKLASELSRTRYKSKWLNAGLEDNINDSGCRKFLFFVVTVYVRGDRDSTMVMMLCYKSKGRWFDPRWCHWNFSLT